MSAANYQANLRNRTLALSPVTLTVSIVTYQPDLALLERCLLSLATALDTARDVGILRDANVVLVDNTGSRATAEAVVHLGEERFKGSGVTMNYLHRHTNIGYGSAHNLVMHGGNTHYHLVLNPDVELAPDAIIAGLAFLNEHPEIGVLAPEVSAPDGQREFLCKRYPAVLAPRLRACGRAPLVPWPTRPVRDARRDPEREWIRLTRACHERLLHAGAKESRRRDRRLRSRILPLFRGLRLERAPEQGRRKRLRACGANRAPRRRRGAERMAAYCLVREERGSVLSQAWLEMDLASVAETCR